MFEKWFDSFVYRYTNLEFTLSYRVLIKHLAFCEDWVLFLTTHRWVGTSFFLFFRNSRKLFQCKKSQHKKMLFFQNIIIILLYIFLFCLSVCLSVCLFVCLFLNHRSVRNIFHMFCGCLHFVIMSSVVYSSS